MRKLHNPYANSLDGLLIEDPVAAFFNFCRERENIRMKRENGQPEPWTNDPIFQKGRFLNVFREDDRGSKAIIRFVKYFKGNLPDLLHALFFCRWCNKQETLDIIAPNILSKPIDLGIALASLNDWCNETAYPVEPIYWNNIKYSRYEAAVNLFAEIKDFLAEIVTMANGNVIVATNSINKIFKMSNDFPIFMAIIDIAWFRPDIINPDSPVPTGIGAVAFLDRLQKHLELENHEQTCHKMIELQKTYWPEARRALYPIDIEYLSCECRKYYSYVNGTKLYEGKNIFVPKKIKD